MALKRHAAGMSLRLLGGLFGVGMFQVLCPWEHEEHGHEGRRGVLGVSSNSLRFLGKVKPNLLGIPWWHSCLLWLNIMFLSFFRLQQHVPKHGTLWAVATRLGARWENRVGTSPSVHSIIPSTPLRFLMDCNTQRKCIYLWTVLVIDSGID